MSDPAAPWTAAHQAPLSMGFSRQEYRSGLPFPSPGDLADLGIEPVSPASLHCRLILTPGATWGARPPWHVTLIPSSEQTGNKGLMIPTLEKRQLRGRWSSQGHRAGTCYDWNCHGSFCLIPESGIFPQCEAASRQEGEENQGATPRATVTDT